MAVVLMIAHRLGPAILEEHYSLAVGGRETLYLHDKSCSLGLNYV